MGWVRVVGTIKVNLWKRLVKDGNTENLYSMEKAEAELMEIRKAIEKLFASRFDKVESSCSVTWDIEDNREWISKETAQEQGISGELLNAAQTINDPYNPRSNELGYVISRYPTALLHIRAHDRHGTKVDGVKVITDIYEYLTGYSLVGLSTRYEDVVSITDNSDTGYLFVKGNRVPIPVYMPR